MIVILTFIYICWYLYLLDICNQENLYILTLVYVVVSIAKKSKMQASNLGLVNDWKFLIEESKTYFIYKVRIGLYPDSFSK